jgi:hypothetical protein
MLSFGRSYYLELWFIGSVEIMQLGIVAPLDKLPVPNKYHKVS